MADHPNIACSAESPGLVIMICAAGRRVALVDIFREALGKLDQPGCVLTTDITQTSPAFHRGDRQALVPAYRNPNCLTAMLELCRRQNVRLMIPTIDPDLPFLAEHHEQFQAIGVSINLSDRRTIDIAKDKQTTHRWLIEQGFGTVAQAYPQQVLDAPGDWPFPLFCKPVAGSASIGAQRVEDAQTLRLLVQRGDYIVQRIAPGREYTVDVYVDRQGCCRCTVPRLRLETRGGEVSKGMTVRNEKVMDLARRVAEALPGARGVMNIQIFHDAPSGQTNVIEINPRFGGGYPLSDRAGATMARWLLEEALGLECTASNEQWQDGLVMLRYDDAVFVDRAEAGLEP